MSNRIRYLISPPRGFCAAFVLGALSGASLTRNRITNQKETTVTDITERLANALGALLSQSAVDGADDYEIDTEVVKSARKSLRDYEEITAKGRQVHGIPRGKEWRAFLFNECGMVTVIGPRAAVLRCIEYHDAGLLTMKT